MEFKHTPGPWHVRNNGPHWNNPSVTNYNIAWSEDGELVAEHVYEEADARLIAAAPDLLLELVALREAIIAHMAGSDAPMNDPYIDQRLAFSADAIAKATGETA